MSVQHTDRNLGITEKTEVNETDTLQAPVLKTMYDTIVALGTGAKELKAFIDKVTAYYNGMIQEDNYKENVLAAAVSEEDLVTSFTNILARSPKINDITISFYRTFMSIIPTKSKSEKEATVIPYASITRIICVPDKNKMRMLSVWMNDKIPLKWRKSSIDSFMVCFNDSSAYEDEDEEDPYPRFAKVVTEMTKLHIDTEKKSVYNGTFHATQSFNQMTVYPLPSGILLTPKPLRFVPRSKIKYYEYSRAGVGLRYYDLDIVLFEDDHNRNTKSKKKENLISLTMIAKKEVAAIDYYFKQMDIKLRQQGATSPPNDPMDEDEDKLSDSDDEEYKIEEDEYQYTDSGGDESDDEEQDSPLIHHDTETRKQSRKRKRKEMESESDKSELQLLNDRYMELEPKRKKKKKKKTARNEEESSPKRFVMRYARKTSFGGRGTGNTVSKSIAKKKKKNKSGDREKKKALCADCGMEFKNGWALGGHRATKHPKNKKKKKDSNKRESESESESVEIIESPSKQTKNKKKKKATLLIPDEGDQNTSPQRTLLDMFHKAET